MFIVLFIALDLLCSGIVAYLMMKAEEISPTTRDVQFSNIHPAAWWITEANLIIDRIYMRYGHRPAVIMTWILTTIYVAPFVAILLLLILAAAQPSSAADYGA